ncbi:MAG TPA: helix-turn-helix transcriptional regulator [Tepidisphaeraceae bacterium]|jgi:DNA-binding CsgD family transcriptional regulator|nr:helix-turn-helix transcriptional regulator [Tepidisphaeraceae bacterium]
MDNQRKNLLDDEIRRLLKLVNQFHTLPPGTDIRQRWLLEGLCNLIGADAGEFAIIEASSQPPYRLRHSLQVAIGPHHPRRLISHQPGRRHVNDPSLQRLLTMLNSPRRKAQMLTHTLHELHILPSPLPADFGNAIYSVLKLTSPTPLVAVLCLAHRRNNISSRAFGSRECQIVHLFHSEAEWPYDRSPSPSTPPASITAHTLTPRQQECLGCLLAGRSEKQIAADMNLSPHTVHVHVKAVYRGLKVSTRAELMAHFMSPRD